MASIAVGILITLYLMCILTLLTSASALKQVVPQIPDSLYIFMCIPPVTNHTMERYLRAIGAWQGVISPTDRIVVYDTREPGVLGFARDAGIHSTTNVITTTWNALPRFDSMVLEAHEYTRRHRGRIAIIVNADIQPSSHVREGLNWLRSLRMNVSACPRTSFGTFKFTGSRTSEWFAVAPRIDVYSGDVKTLHHMGGYDLWAWTVRTPLTETSIPPFRNGRSVYDNWLLNEIITRGNRHVIDLSGCMQLYHFHHQRLFGGSSDWFDAVKIKGDESAYVNRYLSYNNGYRVSLGTWCEAPYVCRHPFRLEQRRVRSNVQCTQRSNQFFTCDGDIDSQECRNEIEIRTERLRLIYNTLPNATKIWTGSPLLKSVQRKWPYTLQRQLLLRRHSTKYIVLTVFNHAYLDMAMNFKCTMDTFNVSEYMMGSFDDMAYNKGILYGLPVFDVRRSYRFTQEMMNEASYGTNSFKRLTKVKSAIVLQILRTNTSVLFCDVDIGWRASPVHALRHLLQLKRTLSIQSNAPLVHLVNKSITGYAPNGAFVQTEAPAGYRRLNSGLYVAPSSPAMIRAFTRIVRHASMSSMTEQPSFYDVLCSTHSEDDSCHDTDITVRTLDRLTFRHGAVLVDNETLPLISYHPNWIVGERSKRWLLSVHSMWRVKDPMLCDVF